jgi:YHS domain-containing protein
MTNSTTTNSFEYEGHCAFAVSTGKTDVKGGKSQATIKGKSYSFSNPVAKLLFKLLPKRIEKANTIWNNK